MNVRWIAFPASIGLLSCLGGVLMMAQTRPAARTAPVATAAKPDAATAKPESPGLTNVDVIKMVQAGLGEGVVMTAIRTAPRTTFQVDAENLIALKKSGVSDNIVALMLDPKAPAAVATPPPVAIAAPSFLGSNPDTRARVDDPNAAVDVPREPGVYIDTGSASTPNLVALEPTTFSQGKSGGMFTSALTYGIKKAQWKAVVRSKSANVRIRENTPTFYFYFEQKSSGLGSSGGFAGWLAGATSPNEFVLAKMAVKERERELVVGEIGAFGSSSGTRSKDTVDFQVEKLSGGVYRVKPNEPLSTGEYSFFYAAGASTLGAGATGKLFDFGVDSQSSIKN